jgi:hypothetical protein
VVYEDVQETSEKVGSFAKRHLDVCNRRELFGCYNATNGKINGRE